MGFLGKLLGMGIGTTVESIAGVVDKFVETEEEKKAAEVVMMKLKQNEAKWQSEITKVQAAHRSIFVAGARPFLLWVCGIGFLFVFLINPILQWALGMPGPVLPVDIMMELTIGMLGLSGLRTIEKITGVAK